MVMELVRGETLEQLLRSRGTAAARSGRVLVDQILSALEHAHRAGVVHRDMKPVERHGDRAGRVKIMDFGVARARGAEHITVDGYSSGRRPTWRRSRCSASSVDERADVYSVGVIFYRLLTRRRFPSRRTRRWACSSSRSRPARRRCASSATTCPSGAKRSFSARSPSRRPIVFRARRSFATRSAARPAWSRRPIWPPSSPSSRAALLRRPRHPPTGTLVLPSADVELPAEVLPSSPRRMHRARAASILVAFAAARRRARLRPDSGRHPRGACRRAASRHPG